MFSKASSIEFVNCLINEMVDFVEVNRNNIDTRGDIYIRL
jgi:hypothetical protein